MADKKEQEEDTEKKPDAKKARKVTADKEGEKKTTDEIPEENKAEEAPEVAVPEPEVSSSIIGKFLIIFDIALDIESNPIP